MPRYRFSLTFKRSFEIIHVVQGADMDAALITADDMQRVPACEALIEKLTGLRVHIESEVVDEIPVAPTD